MKISRTLARRLAVNAQLLDGRTKLPKAKNGIAHIIEKLGYIQIDTISVINRAHHHTLWTRCPDYDEKYLHELQAVDRKVFEYWGHAASYLPISDYRFYLKQMKSFFDPKSKWAKDRYKKVGHLMKPVLKRIEQEGPLCSKDFESGDRKSSNWWDWRPAKSALELLFWRGELMISERRNFSRVYDLTERVLPKNVNTTVPDDNELGRFLVRRALSAYGIAADYEIKEHIHAAGKEIIYKALYDMLENGEIIEVGIDKQKNKKYYALEKMISTNSGLRKNKPRLHILSPFDNLIIQRKRMIDIFDFDYALECYVPVIRRKYGYFVLPLLWGENFAGRMDCKADRKNRRLLVHSIYLENDFKFDDNFITALADKLIGFSRFNQCDSIKIAKCSPAAFKKELNKLLNR
jgi:uncharacterized protein YcaQ